MSALCGICWIRQILDPALLEISGMETLRKNIVVGFLKKEKKPGMVFIVFNEAYVPIIEEVYHE